MLYLIFGKDNFRVHEKLNQIKEKYKTKTGSDLSIEVFNESSSLDQVKNALQFSGFLSAYKLLIFKNFISKAKKDIQKEFYNLLKNIPPRGPFGANSIYIVFIEENENRGSAIVKKIAKEGKIWQLEPLNNYDLLKWIRNKITENKTKISPEAIQTLAFFVGNNLWRMDLEIKKLISFKGRREIADEDVHNLVKPEFSPKIFDLIDFLATKDLKKTQTTLQNLLNSGENPLYIHTMIVYQFRNLIMVKYFTSSGAKTSEIREKTRLHPFVIQKSINQVRNFSYNDLKKIYSRLLDAEIAMKTGKIDQRLALELLVAGLLG